MIPGPDRCSQPTDFRWDGHSLGAGAQLYCFQLRHQKMDQKGIKLLWGRAANRCSICRVELTQDAKAHDAAFALGEQAHIVGEKEHAPRGKSPLTLEERNSYHNIILLCPNHHTEVDKNEADWPVETMHLTKSKHQLWVRETLGEATDAKLLAQQVAVTTIIDVAVEAVLT